jgi:hypothetical protein
MTKLGNKLTTSVKRLGMKMDKGRKALGNKIYDNMGKNQSKFRQVDNTLSEVSKLASIMPGGGKAVALASVGAHIANSIAKKSKKNQLEKYNSRKAIEDRSSNQEALKPGFF